MENFGKFCIAVIVIIFSTLFSGYVLSKLYTWILVPIYHLKPITIAEAIGLSTIVQYFLLGVTMNMKSDLEDKKDSFMVSLLTKLLTGVLTYLLFLLGGYIVSLYI